MKPVRTARGGPILFPAIAALLALPGAAFAHGGISAIGALWSVFFFVVILGGGLVLWLFFVLFVALEKPGSSRRNFARLLVIHTVILVGTFLLIAKTGIGLFEPPVPQLWLLAAAVTGFGTTAVLIFAKRAQRPSGRAGKGDSTFNE